VTFIKYDTYYGGGGDRVRRPRTITAILNICIISNTIIILFGQLSP